MKTNPNPNKKFHNIHRTVLVSSARISVRERKLLQAMHDLLPHTKLVSKDQFQDEDKTSTKRYDLSLLRDVCQSKNASQFIYFDIQSATKNKMTEREFYWMLGRAEEGPTIRFKLHDIMNLDELKLTGNALKGSRPILHFDEAFETKGVLYKLIREMLVHFFQVPRNHPKSKPFVDHMHCFFIDPEGRVVFRNYQILTVRQNRGDKNELMEIGPRFTLEPIRVMDGALGGKILYNNHTFVSNREKSLRLQKEAQYQHKITMEAWKRKQELLAKERNELDSVFAEMNDSSDDSDDGIIEPPIKRRKI